MKMIVFVLFIALSLPAFSQDCSPKTKSEQELLELSFKELTPYFQKLVSKGVNPNVCDPYGSTPINIASFWHQPLMVRFLLTMPKVNVNAVDQFGWPPLGHAVARWNPTIVQMLVDSPRTQFEFVIPKGQNVLHIHAYAGASPNNETISRILLPKATSAMVNQLNDRQLTPLHFAIKNGRIELVKLLLESGKVDFGLTSPQGLDYVAFALAEKQDEIAKVIEAHVHGY